MFGQPVRDPKEDLLNQFHMDIASSIQTVTEEVILRLTKSISKEYGSNNIEEIQTETVINKMNNLLS